MSEWHPQVVRLAKIERHPNADTLEMSEVLGSYPVIFKEGQYQPGDLVAYIPVDTVCSDSPIFDFLGDHKRIKAKKLRGIFSMGMLIPAPPDFKEGDSVVDYYGLVKYEYEEEKVENIKVSKNSESPPKGWTIPYYDLEGLRKGSEILKLDEEVVLTEKLEGSNAAFCHDGERLWVKSRNHFWQQSLDNDYWEAATRFTLEDKLSKYPRFAFFGELYGKVKGFKYDCVMLDSKLQTRIKFFDIFDTKKMKFLDYEEMLSMLSDLELEAVPELYRGPWKGKELWSYAEGQSVLGGNIREGFVVRPIKERLDFKLERVIFKLKGETYMLKKS